VASSKGEIELVNGFVWEETERKKRPDINTFNFLMP